MMRCDSFTTADLVRYTGYETEAGIRKAETKQQAKCRQLPCRTFISGGSCPYGDRCAFLHDPQVAGIAPVRRSQAKAKDDSGFDLFFWPTMPSDVVMSRVDHRNQPVVSQPYLIPTPLSDSNFHGNNDEAVFSMWEHFLDFCKTDYLSVVSAPRYVPSEWKDPTSLCNPHTGRYRLPIFIHLGVNEYPEY